MSNHSVSNHGSYQLMNENCFIVPDWPAPTCVRACSSTRKSGFSEGAYKACNFSIATGDQPEHVDANRRAMASVWGWDFESLCWIKQVHGTTIVDIQSSNAHGVTTGIEGDGAFSQEKKQPCMIATADCLPVLLCDIKGTFVAAVHAGWKGLAAGVLSEAVACYEGDKSQLLAWFGPAISQSHFEVGPEVYATFVALGRNRADCFKAGKGDRWYGDLVALAKCALLDIGVKHFFGGKWCTYTAEDTFYSYRRDGQKSGRMVSAIWMV